MKIDKIDIQNLLVNMVVNKKLLKKNTHKFEKKTLLIKNGLNKFKFETKIYLTTRTAYET